MKLPVDTSFIYDFSQLDRLRRDASSNEHSDDALQAAAEQFEAIFTQMLFKSMRKANEAFESDLIDNRTSHFYQQMADEQLSSSLAREGSLGLADLIVKQFKGPESHKPVSLAALPWREIEPVNPFVKPRQIEENTRPLMPLASRENGLSSNAANENSERNTNGPTAQTQAQEKAFASAGDFVSRLLPYAKKAARALGVDPAILIAQAALETGWGKKIITNSRGSSHNLFNIKADSQWQGQKIAVQTLEFHQDIPVQETASFRAYGDFEDSFNDYVHFLNTNPRYASALAGAQRPDVFIQQLHRAGYATDPEYSDKIMSVFGRVNDLL